MVKISRTTPTRSSAPARKSGKAGGAFAPDVPTTSGVSGADGPGEATPASMLSALIGLQSETFSTARESRTKRIAAAQRTLDLLDGLRHGLLNGAIRLQDLEDIATDAAAARTESVDPGLNEILAEIDLRARVELAKLGR